MSDNKQKYFRFSVAQRIEHWIQVISFTALAVTGLPQKFVGYPRAESIIAFMGGIEAVRVFHRYAALVLTIATIYHGAVVLYKIVVQRVGWSMMPGWQDAKDLVAMIAYNLGLRKEHPKMPRYNVEEKLEYWAFVWGTLVMAITGFMLWNPIAAAEFLPGSFIPAALAAHSGEALLAVLAIIVWHMYGVHIKKFNPSMFTGKLGRAEMEHEHALELEAIESGTQRVTSLKEDQIKRARILVPLLVIIVAALSYGVYRFTTFEKTAITTVEASELYNQEPYQPIDFAEASPHIAITEYSGPKDCATSGCHNPEYVDTAAASDHSKRMAVAGPNPLLAQVATQNNTPPANTTPNCLICHAQKFILHDPVASAQSVGPAGNSTCLRCHTTLEHQGEAHSNAGLGCVSCHTSTSHQIATRVECTSCHLEQPHQNPFINSKHGRLDCRVCHIQDGEQVMIDTAQAARNDITGYFAPAMKTQPADAAFTWQAKIGAIISSPTDDAKIIPITSLIIQVAADFDPVDFAHTGGDNGSATAELTLQLIPSHKVIKEGRDCSSCHGTEAKFDFLSLGYDEETADKLSLKKVKTDEK